MGARYRLVAGVVLAVIFFEALPLLAIQSLKPPNPMPETAPDGEFSSARAAKHVALISREPHPCGTPEHLRVQQYLIGEFEKAGLEVRLEEVPSIRAISPDKELVPLKNIVARLPGTSGTKAVLLSAHYDTNPRAPGAGDDSSGVAVLLETARALRAGRRLKNDVIVLITDGEEQGLLGAAGFLAEDERARNVGLVINFDSRGNSGPAVMYETSCGNPALIRQFARAADRPVANSLAPAVSERLPNTTDFRHYKRAGIPGFNFALIDGYAAYHSALDTPDNLSEASLQHQGSNALALARHFGELDLSAGEFAAGDDAIYFNVWGGILVTYPRRWSIPAAALTFIVFAAAIAAGFRYGAMRPKPLAIGMAAGLGRSLGLTALTIVLVLISVQVAARLAMPRLLPPRGENLGSLLMTLCLWNVAFSLVSLVNRPDRIKPSHGITSLGFAIPWLFLCVMTSAFLPGASFLFTWPLLFALPGHIILSARKPEDTISAPKEFAIALCGLPTLILLPQALYLFFLALVPNPAIAVCVLMFLSVQTVGLLLPQLELVTHRSRWIMPLTGALGALTCFVSQVIAIS
jgi:hypothetical protein